MGTLYLVATPIGNLEDITRRALHTLREVSLIAAEDTRQTRVLLEHYEIETPLTSYFEHNKLAKIDGVLAQLTTGDVALVSDAGTPTLNDPGYELVRAALEAGFQVSPIPGPSAPLAALVASGLPTDRFLYLGYLPRKKSARRQMLTEVAGHPFTLIFLETPHRLVSALADIEAVLGNRQLAVARELTKLYEEFFRGTAHAAHEHFTVHKPRGEFTLVVAGAPQTAGRWSRAQLERAIHEARAAGSPPSQIARDLAALSGWSRREIYPMVIGIEDSEGTTGKAGG
jgi:16S rRNA (cytidine1402-2'-O)-methyltransferase